MILLKIVEGLKVKINPFENNVFYKKSNEIDQALLISTNRADFIIQFVMKSGKYIKGHFKLCCLNVSNFKIDYLEVMDWINKLSHQEKANEA